MFSKRQIFAASFTLAALTATASEAAMIGATNARSLAGMTLVSETSEQVFLPLKARTDHGRAPALLLGAQLDQGALMRTLTQFCRDQGNTQDCILGPLKLTSIPAVSAKIADLQRSS